MTTLYGPDGFGSGWAGWSNLASSSGSFTDTSGGWGRMDAGNPTGYSGVVARRVTGLSVADVRIQFKFQYVGTNNGDLRVGLRGDTTDATKAGYILTITKGNQKARLWRTQAYSPTALGDNIDYELVGGVTHNVDFSVVGPTLKAYIWPEGEAKPSTPSLTATDYVITSPNAVNLVVIGGASAHQQVLIDDVLVTDGAGEILGAGAAPATGSLRKVAGKRFAGTTTGAGTLSKTKVVLQVFTGTVAPVGDFIKAFPRKFTGSATAIGQLRKRAGKVLTGTSAVSGQVRRGYPRTFTGEVTATGSVVASWLGRLVGRPGTVKIVLRPAAWIGIRLRGGD